MRTILVAAALLLAGCIDPAPADNEPTPSEGDPAVEMWSAFFVNETGSVGPVGGQGTSGEFEVPNGTGRLTINLLWQDPIAQLRVELSGPGSDGGTYASPGNGRVQGDIPEPTPGVWAWQVSAERQISVPFSISFYVAPDDSIVTVLEETVTIPAGSFFEINTQMEEGARIHWDWETDDDSAYNVHTHFDGEVQYLVEVTAQDHVGSVVQNRTGGLSLMWEADTPVTLTYRAWGAFEVDSYFPPR